MSLSDDERMLARALKTTVRRLGWDIRRYVAEYRDACVPLRTRSQRTRGSVLLAYIVEPFLSATAPSVAHTHFQESRLIAEAYLERGYDVDVIDYRHGTFVPRRDYDIIVSARTNLEALANRSARTQHVIAHLDTAHYVYNNRAAYDRLLALQQRRGLTSTSVRIVEPNLAIERASIGAVLGNRTFTATTYAYARKPLYPLPVPSAVSLPWIERDYDACRRRFLWMGSAGFVHKGLDLVLETFATNPSLELDVCGPLAQDREFAAQFERELYDTPNIHAVGWIDVGSDRFIDIARSTVGFVYPSCSEGQAGSAVVALHAGLIPIVSRQTGIDVGDFGLVLSNCSAAEIDAAVRHISELSTVELRQRSRAAWEYAQAHHTPSAYRQAYDTMLDAVLTK